MNKAVVVAKWEYLEKVKSKAFLIGLFLTPMIMVLMGVLPGLLASREDDTTKLVGVIDATGELYQPLSAQMEKYKLSNGQPNYVLLPLGVGKDLDLPLVTADADAKVMRDDIEAYIVLRANVFADSVVEVRSKTAGDFRLIGRLESTLKTILAERKFAARGLDPQLADELKVPLDIKTVKLSKSGEKEETDFLRTFFSAYIFLMMLFFLIFTSGQLLVRSVIEEKSNRIVEVLVSSCTPTELMAGKVLGLSALGLTQMGFWAVMGLAVTLQFGAAAFPPVSQLLLLLVYFVLGYLFYCGVFIALGTPVTTEQEAQQINSYLVLFLVLPIALVMPVMQHPNATWVKLLTYIPFFTPTFMALRIPIQTPGIGEIIATILILIASVYFMMLVAGRIFRIAILATGKRPGIAELVRWVKAG